MSSMTPPARRALLLAQAALVLTLAACGGFTAVDVGGTINGLTGNGLILSNGASTVAPPASATTFKFPVQVDIRATYAVSIVAQPARQTCTVFNPSGTAGAAPVTIVNVACAANTYTISGTVTGLTGTGLVLTNGSDQATVAAGDANGNAGFTFPTQVADGTVYGIAVLTQPAGQTCSVSNGTATMGGAPVTNVQVACR